MRLKDCDSSAFLPAFADAIEYTTNALDYWVKQATIRAAVFSSPWTLESIEALTEEELLQKYKELSLGKYYHDLPRSYRNQFLFEQIQNQKILTTKKAIESLLKYILVNPDFQLDIDDNITGQLFKYNLFITTDNFPQDDRTENRIKENLKIFVRASAELLKIYFEGKDYFIEQPLIACLSAGTIQGFTYVPDSKNKTIYEPNKFLRINSTTITNATTFYSRLRGVYGFPNSTSYNNTYLKPVFESVTGGTPYTIDASSVFGGYAYASQHDIDNSLRPYQAYINYTVLSAY